MYFYLKSKKKISNKKLKTVFKYIYVYKVLDLESKNNKIRVQWFLKKLFVDAKTDVIPAPLGSK